MNIIFFSSFFFLLVVSSSLRLYWKEAASQTSLRWASDETKSEPKKDKQLSKNEFTFLPEVTERTGILISENTNEERQKAQPYRELQREHTQ